MFVCTFLLFYFFFFSFSSSPFSILDECGWCKRVIPFSSEFSATSEGLKFCSESCFTQSRRASYKRAKTCDWCKHIRHAVSYVDFQDGASQLQFCSDKCLNQYKMQIFCKETQAHLDMNPHLKEKGKTSNETLITPDLWLRNCRSRSMTPDQRSNDSCATESPTGSQSTAANAMPTIKVAPVSKLLSCDHESTTATISQRPHREEPTSELKNYSHFAQKTRAMRKRRTNRLSSSSNERQQTNGSISERTNNNDSSNENRNIHGKMHATNLMTDKSVRMNLLQPSLMASLPPKISPSTGKNASIDEANFLQRYQLMSQPAPNLFAINDNRSLHQALRQSAPFIAPLIPNHPFAGDACPPEMISKIPSGHIPLSKLLPMQRQRSEPTPSISSARKPFGSESNPLFMMQQQQQQQKPQMAFGNVFAGMPPTTILVPYPIILPLPLPIPIPLPYEAFLRAAECNQKDKKQPNGRCSSTSTIDEDVNRNGHKTIAAHDQPLDFTKTKMANTTLKISDDDSDDEDDSVGMSPHKIHSKSDLAKFRAIRQSKRAHTKDSTSENNRPLRKRKRVIDCDYMRLRESNSSESSNPRKSI